MTNNDDANDPAKPGAKASDGSGERTPHFAEALRSYRDSYGERLKGNRPGQPRMQLTASALLESMRELGYFMSSSSYSMIEAGDTAPRDPERFIQVVAQCLNLSRRDQERLARAYAYDYLKLKLGEEWADKILPL